MDKFSFTLPKLFSVLISIIILAGCVAAPVDTSGPNPTLESLMDGLAGLGPEAFMAEAYQRWVLRFPQTVTALGLAGIYGVDNCDLDGYDMDYLLLTQSFESALLQQARSFDLVSLPEGTRFDLRVFIGFMEQRVALHPYQWLGFPFRNEKGSLSDQYVYLLMVQQPFRDEADVLEYLGRLAAIGPQIDQLVGYLQIRQERGIRIPYLLYAEVMEEMGAHDWEVGWKTPFVTILAVRLQDMDTLTHEEREAYYEKGGRIADEVILPAFERLMDALYAMAEDTTEAIGLSAQPLGEAAYQVFLDQVTTLEIQADELFLQAETQVRELGEAVRSAAREAGYDALLPLQEIFRQARVDRDYALGLDIFVTLRSLMLDVESEMDSVLESLDENDLVMVPVYEGGFYEPAALDNSRPAAFYAGFSGQEAYIDLPTRVYHETFPGRHYQASSTRNSNLPLFRKAMRFIAFDEGWALYAEYLAGEMGMYAEDPNANLGRLQSELLAAAGVVVDIGIHTLGWDAQKAARYLVDYAGIDRVAANEMVLLQAAQPAEAVAGYAGYQFIRDLRDDMEDHLGDAFDLKAFHMAVLSGGSLPLPLLEEQVRNALEGDI